MRLANVCEVAVVPVICPTCQCVSGSDVSIIPLLCMGLFSIFFGGVLASRRCRTAAWDNRRSPLIPWIVLSLRLGLLPKCDALA